MKAGARFPTIMTTAACTFSKLHLQQKTWWLPKPNADRKKIAI
jgi:hypothetical protein